MPQKNRTTKFVHQSRNAGPRGPAVARTPPSREATTQGLKRMPLRPGGRFEDRDPKLLMALLKHGSLNINVNAGEARERGDALRLVLRANDLLNDVRNEVLKQYLAFIHIQVLHAPNILERVQLTYLLEGADASGHYAPSTRTVMLSVGTICSDGVVMKTPTEFLELVVHEFTHVLDYLARATNREITVKALDYRTHYCNFIYGDLDHERITKPFLETLVTKSVADHYNQRDLPALTWSEILARFAAVGVTKRAPAQMALGFLEFAKAAPLPKLQDARLAKIIHYIIVPFIDAVDDPACRRFFTEIVLFIESGSQLANRGREFALVMLLALLGTPP